MMEKPTKRSHHTYTLDRRYLGFYARIEDGDDILWATSRYSSSVRLMNMHEFTHDGKIRFLFEIANERTLRCVMEDLEMLNIPILY